MSLRAELETWDSALKAYDAEDFDKALELFSRIADSSKILTNMGLIYATLGEHELAVEQFNAATGLDQYLAVAYFQCGVSNFLLGRYDLALKDFEDALLYLRGNQAINYEQLGLQFRLYSAEVLFNRGLCQIYMSNENEGLRDLEDAKKEKVTDEHKVIDEAIRDAGEGYTVFSIPVGILYRPAENKMKNAKPKDYLGKAKLVAAENPNEAYTTFTGVTRMQQGYTPSGAPIDDQNMRGADLKPAPSFSRARNPENPSKAVLERSTSLNGRLERSNTAAGTTPRGGGGPGNSGGGANLQKSNTLAARPGPGSGRSISPAPPAGGRAGGGDRGGGGPRGGGGARNPPGDDGVAGATGSMRGLSLRRQEGGGPGGPGPDKRSPPAGSRGPGAGAAAGGKDSRLTDIYADYLDDYGGEEEPPLPDEGRSVQAWRSRTKPGSPVGPSRAPSQRAGNASQARSQYGGTSVSRRPTGRQPPRGGSNYGGDDDSYVSGDEGSELLRIKVKIHFSGEVRGMALTPDVPFEEFVDRVHSKFSKNFGEMVMKFIDEDGMKVSLRDESDYDLAIETARDSAGGKPDGKLVIWVE